MTPKIKNYLIWVGPSYRIKKFFTLVFVNVGDVLIIKHRIVFNNVDIINETHFAMQVAFFRCFSQSDVKSLITLSWFKNRL